MAGGKNSKTNMRARAHEAVDKMMDRQEEMRENMQERIENAKEKMAEMRENMKTYVSENPEKAMLIAAGIGAAIGILFTAMVMRRRNA